MLEKSSIKTWTSRWSGMSAVTCIPPLKMITRTGDRARLVSPRYFIKLIPDSLYCPLLFT